MVAQPADGEGESPEKTTNTALTLQSPEITADTALTLQSPEITADTALTLQSPEITAETTSEPCSSPSPPSEQSSDSCKKRSYDKCIDSRKQHDSVNMDRVTEMDSQLEDDIGNSRDETSYPDLAELVGDVSRKRRKLQENVMSTTTAVKSVYDYMHYDPDKEALRQKTERILGSIRSEDGEKVCRKPVPVRYDFSKVNADYPEFAVAGAIAYRLREKKQNLIHRVVERIGKEKSLELLFRTEEIERNGGEMTARGVRRKEAGGVFLGLLKKEVSAEDVKHIFTVETELENASFTARKKQRKINKKRRYAKNKSERNLSNALTNLLSVT